MYEVVVVMEMLRCQRCLEYNMFDKGFDGVKWKQYNRKVIEFQVVIWVRLLQLFRVEIMLLYFLDIFGEKIQC